MGIKTGEIQVEKLPKSKRDSSYYDTTNQSATDRTNNERAPSLMKNAI